MGILWAHTGTIGCTVLNRHIKSHKLRVSSGLIQVLWDYSNGELSHGQTHPAVNYPSPVRMGRQHK